MEGFNSFVETTWKSLNIIEPNGLIRLKKKLQALKIAIKAWSKEANKRSNDRKINIQQNLSEVDKIIDQGKTLIPNIQDAKVKHFRPTSLIGSIYKIIAKILANRLCVVLPYLISDVQSAFVANRQILNGPFILNELLSWCKFKKLNEMIFKMDFEKAFDSVKWDYLDKTLKAFDFGSKWRNWISSCLNNVMGSVLVNGNPTLEFQFHKGFKQGVRLSLLNSVLTSIPLYHMSIFKVPIGVLNHLESIRRNFFYGVDGSDRKLAWIGWNMVLTSKKNSGLSVSSFFAHNRAFFFKWVWRFLTDGSSLWTRFIKAIFGNKGPLYTHKLIPRRSSWQDVILAIYSLQREVALKVLYKRLYALEMCKYISVAEKMGHLSLSHSFRRMPRDRWCWPLEGSQEYSVKSSRILIDNTILPKAEVPTRWLRVVPIKVNVHVWTVCLDKLPTRANISLKGMDIPSIACPLWCGEDNEQYLVLFIGGKHFAG
nr:hypothetical protein [Tanacetum cinerariifolium]